MQLISSQQAVAKKIISWCLAKGFNTNSITAILGNAYAESALRLNNVQGSYEKTVGTDDIYTDKINNGTYSREQFTKDKAGYGLFQWTYHTRKATMYDVMKKLKKNIDSWEVCEEMLNKELLPYKTRLNKCTDYIKCSEILVKEFLRPADQSETAIKRRANYGVEVVKVVPTQQEETKQTIVYEDDFVIVIRKGGN